MKFYVDSKWLKNIKVNDVLFWLTDNRTYFVGVDMSAIKNAATFSIQIVQLSWSALD